MGRITEKDIASVLNAAAHVLVTQKVQRSDGTSVESLRRIALDTFFAELYDARKTTSGQSYESVGAFLRAIADKVEGGAVIDDTQLAKHIAAYMEEHPVESGEDGYSPTVTVEETVAGAIIRATDVNGTTVATVKHGTDGVDGTSASFSVQQTDEGAIVKAKDSSGETTATLRHGTDGISPTVTVTETEDGATIETTDKNGSTSVNIKHGEPGERGLTGQTPIRGTDYFTEEDIQNIKDALYADLPVAIADDGYSDFYGLRQPINTSIVKNDRVITMTTTLEGNKVTTTSLTLDADGYPVQVVSNGVACSIVWDGFTTTEEEGSE